MHVLLIVHPFHQQIQHNQTLNSESHIFWTIPTSLIYFSHAQFDTFLWFIFLLICSLKLIFISNLAKWLLQFHNYHLLIHYLKQPVYNFSNFAQLKNLYFHEVYDLMCLFGMIKCRICYSYLYSFHYLPVK